jgi:hypothetical protein
VSVACAALADVTSESGEEKAMPVLSTRFVCVCALLAAFASSASAQLVFGSTTTSTANPCAMYLDVDTQQVTTLWNSASNKKVNGLAADTATGHLYSNDAPRLNIWNYGSLGTVPTFIAGMYRTDGTTFTATGVNDLTFANGLLYGGTSYPSTVYKRGIYQINTVPDAGNHCVMTAAWLDPTFTTTFPSGLLSMTGVEYNAADNLFYMINTNDTTPQGFTYTPGLYSVDVFGTGTATRIGDLPAGRTKVDGMAIGGGKFWLTEQEPGASRIDIYPYDPVAHTYGTTLYVPLTDATQRATGAAWAPGANALFPEPGTFGLLAILAVGAFRRR